MARASVGGYIVGHKTSFGDHEAECARVVV